ncbi:unnamed protein product [Linum trigynum]|uniref:Uncharacterized protein n=1 Tax=Linum trigynum TaxID=586398 RepID=A0AAV2GNI8_9ROSI
MKSNKVFGTSKRNAVNFIQPSSLRKNVRTRQFFSSISTSGGDCSHHTMYSGAPSRRAHVFETSSSSIPNTGPIASTDEDDFVMHVEGANEVESNAPSLQENFTEPIVVVKRKVRSMSKCKRVGKLRPGEKLPIVFFRNGPVGVNKSEFSRKNFQTLRWRYIRVI